MQTERLRTDLVNVTVRIARLNVKRVARINAVKVGRARRVHDVRIGVLYARVALCTEVCTAYTQEACRTVSVRALCLKQSRDVREFIKHGVRAFHLEHGVCNDRHICFSPSYLLILLSGPGMPLCSSLEFVRMPSSHETFFALRLARTAFS